MDQAFNYPYPPVMSERETIAAAMAGKTLSRFGDGELRLALGGGAVAQRPDPKCAAELRRILGDRHASVLPCIPNAVETPRQDVWTQYRGTRFTRLMRLSVYGSSFVTRPDSAPWIDTDDYWRSVRDLWFGRSCILVKGSDKSLVGDSLVGAAGVVVINGPERDAYDAIDDLERRIVQARGNDPGALVVLCLGPAATCLAYRIACRGTQALDLGHVGMFMKHAGAYRHGPGEFVSPQYRSLLIKKHKAGRWGVDGHRHTSEVQSLATKVGARAVLDYGCGAGTLKPTLSVKCFEYDPGLPGKDGLPKPAEVVACTDVMEHVETDKVDAVLRHIHALTGVVCYMVVSTRDAREILPDGRNAHLTVKPAEWWKDRVEAVGFKIAESVVGKKDIRLWLTK